MSLARISQASAIARARAQAGPRRDGAPPQSVKEIISRAATPGPRELKQQLLETMLAGANANRVREIATSRPDLMEAASAGQRARMGKALLDRLFFGSADRQALLAILKPAAALGELPATAAAFKGQGKLGALFRQIGDEGEGLDLARLGLATPGFYDDPAVVAEMGVTGVKALVRVATNEHLDALTREAKIGMISALQGASQTDEIEVMIRRLRNHLH